MNAKLQNYVVVPLAVCLWILVIVSCAYKAGKRAGQPKEVPCYAMRYWHEGRMELYETTMPIGTVADWPRVRREHVKMMNTVARRALTPSQP